MEKTKQNLTFCNYCNKLIEYNLKKYGYYCIECHRLVLEYNKEE